jgi:hypothetical protein
VNRSGERPAAAERGRWLAELAEAVTEAQRLARSLSVVNGNHAEAEDLYGRLELVRIEVDDLRRGGRGARPARNDPFWASLFPSNSRPKF